MPVKPVAKVIKAKLALKVFLETTDKMAKPEHKEKLVHRVQ